MRGRGRRTPGRRPGVSRAIFRVVLSGFHSVVERWFAGRFAEPTEPQRRAWPVIQGGGAVLIAAPTGSGKTFAAFLSAIDSLVRQGLEGTLRDETQVLYVSPLKALSNDEIGRASCRERVC